MLFGGLWVLCTPASSLAGRPAGDARRRRGGSYRWRRRISIRSRVARGASAYFRGENPRARARRRFPRRLTSADKSPYCPYSYRNMGTARIANRMSRRRASENRPSMESGDRRYQSDSMVFGVAIPCAACPRFQSVDKAPASPNIRLRSRGGFLQKPGRA